MAPHAAWLAMIAAERQHDWETAAETAQSLLDWLTRGGFAPRVRHVSGLPPRQQGVAVARVCRRYLRLARRQGRPR